MIVIDLTAELAPVVCGLGVVAVLAALGIVACIDPREIPALRRWWHLGREAWGGLRGGRTARPLVSAPRG